MELSKQRTIQAAEVIQQQKSVISLFDMIENNRRDVDMTIHENTTRD